MKKLIFYVLLSVMYLSISAVGYAENENIKQISSQELKSELDSGAKVLLVDARSSAEYDKGHLPGAINVSPNKFRSIAKYLPKDKGYPIVFYCRGYG